MRNLRKFTRFLTDVEVSFKDKTEAKGKIVDASREGALIILSSKLKPINAFVAFTVHIPADEEKEIEKQEISMVGKVIHHTKHQSLDAMGIQFLELSSQDLSKWLRFLGSAKQDQETFLVRTIDPNHPDQDYPGFTIRFKSLEKLKNFFPSTLSESFYISTSIKKSLGDILHVTLVHPENERLLQFLAVVEKEAPHPRKQNKPVLYCRFYKPKSTLIEEIEKFCT